MAASVPFQNSDYNSIVKDIRSLADLATTLEKMKASNIDTDNYESGRQYIIQELKILLKQWFPEKP